MRLPNWATFARHVLEGIIEHVRVHREPWRISYMAQSTNEIAPVKIDRKWRGDGLIVFRPTAAEVDEWSRARIRS